MGSSVITRDINTSRDTILLRRRTNTRTQHAKGATYALSPHAARTLEYLAMLAILALAATLDFWRLTENGFANLYYAAAVRSMAQSWHAFFFVGYDSGGYITIDKPPLGFWAQVASVRLFGFTSFGLLFPQALAGVLSVGALWRIVRRAFGPVAGVLAALALAISPTNVVVNRSNLLEPLLLLTLLLATWAVLRATDDGSLGWLLVGAVLVGLGFNIKMLEAYLVVPALVVVYLLGARIRWRKRFVRLALAGAVLLVVSLIWATAVDLTPATLRPYVGSSQNDSELGLALGYNGVIRLVGAGSHPRATPQDTVKIVPSASQSHLTSGTLATLAICTTQLIPATTAHPSTPTPAASNADPFSVTGRPGLGRLWQPFPGAQVSWLLPLALIGLLLGMFESVLAFFRRRSAPQTTQKRSNAIIRAPWRLESEQQGYALWGMWLLTIGLFLSVAQFINVYYVALLAPSICALAAVGAVRLWQAYRAHGMQGMRGWRSWLLPVALLITAAEQAYLVGAAPDWASWLRVTALLDVALIAGLLMALPLMWRMWGETGDDAIDAHPHSNSGPRSQVVAPIHSLPGARAIAWASTLALAALVITPLLWSCASLTPGNAGAFPAAGPEYAQMGAAPTTPDTLVDPRLLSYLAAHRNGTAYLVATVDSYTASPIIVATGQPVMSLGGYSGGESIVTVDQLANLVAHNTVRLFLIPATNLTPAQRARLYPPSWRQRLAEQHETGHAITKPDATSSPGVTSYTNALTAWMSANCTPIQPILWNSAPYATYRTGPLQLFAC